MTISRRTVLAGALAAPAIAASTRLGSAAPAQTLKISHQFPGGSHHVRAQASGKMASRKIVCSCERVRRFLPAIFSVRHPRKRAIVLSPRSWFDDVCCALVASGHATAVPLSSDINSRLFRLRLRCFDPGFEPVALRPIALCSTQNSETG